MAREDGPDLQREVNEHVFRLNRSVARLRAQLDEMENHLPDHPGSRSALVRRMTGMASEIDAIYRTMVRVRWAALGVPPSSGTSESPVMDPTGGPLPVIDERKPTIHVVGDDPSVRKAYSRLLRSMDYVVETFPSASHFLAAGPGAGAGPACLVLDQRMAPGGGLDLQQKLAEAGAVIPIILITGPRDLDHTARVAKDPSVHFLPKPFDDEDLLDAVGRALQSPPEWDQSPIPKLPRES